MKLDDLTKKVFPAQARERLQWQLDAIKANQNITGHILLSICRNEIEAVKLFLKDMHKADRDAILQSGGILTNEQIEVLKG